MISTVGSTGRPQSQLRLTAPLRRPRDRRRERATGQGGAMQTPRARYRDERAILLGGIACVLGYTIVSRTGDLDAHRARLAIVVMSAWLVFGFAAHMVFRQAHQAGPTRPDPGRHRRRLVLVVLLAGCCQLPGVLTAPQSSADAYRYVWDGRVQLAGVSPYRYVPLDDHLARLRDPLLFPGLGPDQNSGVRTLDHLPQERAQILQLAHNDPRTRINRPRVPTIYPPLAQAWFTSVAALTPRPLGTLGLQVGSALLAIALTLGIGLMLARRGADPAQALWWGWCPLVVLEAGNGAHVDILATVLIVATVAVLTVDTENHRRRWIPGLAGGALLGLAAAVKILPLLLLPAVTVLRARHGGARWHLGIPAAAVATFALTYLPHVVAVGALVLGYLPGYLSEEGFSDGGSRYAVIGLVLPGPARQPVALLLAAALAVLALWRCERARPERTAVWLFGAALLITTPAYAWYGLPLVALAVLAGRLEWLAVAVAGYLAYASIRLPYLPGLSYGGAALVVMVVTVARRAGATTSATGPAFSAKP
jgi:hypothetical protein